MKIIAVALALGALALADTKLGRPLSLKHPMTVEQLHQQSAALTGKVVQVRGKVTEVCQMMGCWMALVGSDGSALIRIKVRDGDIVFPKEAVGKTAIAEGKLEKLKLTKEQAIARAKHEAEEQGRKFDPASIQAGITVYQINGTGAAILNP